jgi:hypothetical protein
MDTNSRSQDFRRYLDTYVINEQVTTGYSRRVHSEMHGNHPCREGSIRM